MPDRLVISNTSPLLYLHQVGRLDLLWRLYGQIQIPLAVKNELIAGSTGRRGGICGCVVSTSTERDRLIVYNLVLRRRTTMITTELRVELPSSLSQEEAKLLLAVKLFEVGKVSLGQAAKMAELSKRTFMEILGRYGVPVFNYSPEELRTEVDV
jgi:predicted HTH domain antitoxin